MPTIFNLVVWGEQWVNRYDIIKQLYTVPANKMVIIHTQHEGVSLKATGILQVVDEWVASTGRDPATVNFNTPNHYEKINYKFSNHIPNKFYHTFFKQSLIKYHCNYIPINLNSKLFGLFLGRYTPIRNTIACNIVANYYPNFLISVMNADRLGAEQWWDPEIEVVGSLDNASIPDQYDNKHNTNQSLLQFYNDFQIELAVETVTQGEAFFITEKTVRPIMGSKPFMTYATTNFLANLRDLGFRTFGKLWSEDYDQYEGIERWNRMHLVISNIIEQGYDCDLAQEIVQYNYNHLHNNIIIRHE